MTDPWAQSLTGTTLGPYRLERCMGKGAFGYVFEVTSQDAAGSYAMKVLSPAKVTDASAVLDFENEGSLLKKLSPCSSVIDLVDSGAEEVWVTLGVGKVPLQLKYHVLALASGSLDELLASPATRDDLAWSDKIRLWRGAVKGVHQMHLKSVAHRDLKSSNCLLMVNGSRSEVMLADLGRSKDYSRAPSAPLEAYLSGRGDLRYAPPEYLLFQGGMADVDFQNADLYGLGSLLVELATGQPMTAIALTSWVEVQALGLEDLRNGFSRDLATLRPNFRSAIDAISEHFPRAIRHDAMELITQLCDPVPGARRPRRSPGRRDHSESGLQWLLHRSDILGRRLAVAPKRHRTRSREKERSA